MDRRFHGRDRRQAQRAKRAVCIFIGSDRRFHGRDRRQAQRAKRAVCIFIGSDLERSKKIRIKTKRD